MKSPKEGQRVRLTGKMVNHDSTWMPEENIPVGTEGTVVWASDGGPHSNIGVRWDNGRSLALLPHDQFEIL